MNKYTWKIIGHEQIINFLEKSILSQRLSHAYLFYGPKGIGKCSLANRFSQILQCASDKSRPCEHCPACQQIKKRIHPDVTIVSKEQDKKNISIEQIRELEHRLSMSSFTQHQGLGAGFNNSYKIAIIDEAETLSREAWDSLLKTLEEPSAHTTIILITSQIHRLPETIISRSQVLRFNPIPTPKITKYLVQELKIEKNQAGTLAHLSFGRLGQAMKFIENPQSFIEYKKQVANFINLLNSNLSEKLKFVEKDKNKKDSFLESIGKYQNLLQIWSLIIRDLTLLKLAQQNLVNSHAKPELEKLKNSFSLSQLKNILNQIEQTKQYLSANASPKLAMENLLIRI